MKSILILMVAVITTNLAGCVYPAYRDHGDDRYENRRDHDEGEHRGERRGDDRKDDRGHHDD